MAIKVTNNRVYGCYQAYRCLITLRVGRYLLQNMSRHSEQVYYDKMVSAISSLQLFSNSKLYWNLFPLMYLYCVNPIMSEQRHTKKVHLVI